MRIEPVFLFDLDGTLVDSVYQHVLAWKEALDSEGVDLSVWRIHRKIGMSGGLFTNQLRRETGVDLGEDRLERLRDLHVEAYCRMSDHIRPLPGARELLAFLTNAGLPMGDRHQRPNGDGVGQPRGAGRRSRSDPGRNARSGQTRQARSRPVPGRRRPLERADRESLVVGDSIWDMLAAARCRALGVGLLCGGYGASELQQATAFRVYEDPADLLVHIDELGGRR